MNILLLLKQSVWASQLLVLSIPIAIPTELTLLFLPTMMQQNQLPSLPITSLLPSQKDLPKDKLPRTKKAMKEMWTRRMKKEPHVWKQKHKLKVDVDVAADRAVVPEEV